MADFIARIKPKKSSVAGEAPLAADLEVAEIAVNTADGKLFVKHTDDTIKEISGSGGGSSGTADGSVRKSVPKSTTAALAQGASEDVTFTGTGRAGQFLKVESSCAAWVVFYSSQAARTADAGRPSTDNPSQGAGVLMEVFFDQAEMALITPSVLYFNNDANQGAEIYAKITNLDPVTQAVTVTTTVVPTEGRAVYEAQGTVRSKPLSVTTSLIADAASEDLTLDQTARSGQFITLESSHAARVIFYSNKAARTADTGRAQGTSPAGSSGVLLEVVTTGAQTLEITPAVLYQNTEPGAAGELYLSVTNLSGSDAEVEIITTVVPIEGRGAYLSELSELLDVDTTGVVDGNAIVYDAAASKWIPGAGGGGFSGSYNDLTDKPSIPPTAPVDSVNGEVGAVSLGIQDMDDFELFTTPPVSYSYPNYQGGGNAPQAAGYFRDFSYSGEYFLQCHNDDENGSDLRTAFLLLSSPGSIWLSSDGVNFTEEPYETLSTGSSVVNFRRTTGSWNPPDPLFLSLSDPGSPADIPLADGEILQWNAVDQKFKPAQLPAGGGGAVDSVNGETGAVSLTLSDINDVSAEIASTGEVLYWDQNEYKHSSVPDLLAGRETVTPVVSVTVTSDTGMAGSSGLYADNAALESDGFTRITSANDADDGTIIVPTIAGAWDSDFDSVNYIGRTLSGPLALKINSNGTAYLDGASNSYSGRSGNFGNDHPNAPLCIAWASQDAEIRRSGYKRVTQDGTTWFVLRVDFKVPYSNETEGLPAEVWFGQDSQIRQYYGTYAGSSGNFTTSPTHQGISESGTILTNVTTLTSSGDQRIAYGAPATVPGFAGAKLEDLSDVGTPADDYILIYDTATTSWVPEPIAPVATTNNYNDLSNTPALAAVATSGDYTDLINTPIGAVSSVNGETGVVSLGIQEMDDFELNQQANSDGPWSTGGSASNSPGHWREFADSSNRLVFFNYSQDDGTDVSAPYLALVDGDSISFSGDGNNYYTFTLEGDATDNSGEVLIKTAEDPSIVKTFTTLYVAKGFTGVPIADADILQWNSVQQKFKPAQLPVIPDTAITWQLTANGSTDYVFTGPGLDGVNDPTIYLMRGQTYKFVNEMNAHPFRIRQVGGSTYSSGITNNDVSNGTLTFEVPMDAPATLEYVCTAHPAMTGLIHILAEDSISLATLKTEVAASTDFANFQARIAAL